MYFKGRKKSSRKDTIFYLTPSQSLKPIVILLGFSWLIPVMIIILFNLVASLLYKYVFNFSPSYIYSDVLENYDICFIKNIGSYLLGCCLPSFLLFAASLLILFLIALHIQRRLIFLRSSIIQLLGQRLVNTVLHDTAENMLKFKLVSINGTLFLGVFLVNLAAAIQIRSGHIGFFVLFCAFEFLYALLVAFFMFSFFMFESSLHKNDEYAKSNDLDNDDANEKFSQTDRIFGDGGLNEIEEETQQPNGFINKGMAKN